MQRKAYVPGIAALLAALLAGCTGGSGSKGTAADPKPGDVSVNTPAAQPGKYRTLPEACAAVSHDSLDFLLPGIRQITDQDRRYGLRGPGHPHLRHRPPRRLRLEGGVHGRHRPSQRRLRARGLVRQRGERRLPRPGHLRDRGATAAANLPEASASATPSGSGSATATPSATPSSSVSSTASASASTSRPQPDPRRPPAPQAQRSGDQAFLNDKLNSGSSTAQQRTVTVVFRTSNVIVRIEYAEQPTASTGTPDSKEMQDKARNLAHKLVDRFNG